jgi:TRAP-type mannitol/chloroaromatic compound transport system substrate-binding protein
MMKKSLILVLLTGLISSCTGGNEPITSSHTSEYQTYKWRLVTSWPKNYPGLGMAPERIA